jgi:prepilin signal peptidase PulO-like enzyme (type II secretory pathway)
MSNSKNCFHWEPGDSLRDYLLVEKQSSLLASAIISTSVLFSWGGHLKTTKNCIDFSYGIRRNSNLYCLLDYNWYYFAGLIRVTVTYIVLWIGYTNGSM